MSSAINSNLCASCSSLDFNVLLHGQTPMQRPTNEFDIIRDLSSVLKEVQCPLCRLLVACCSKIDDFDDVHFGIFDQVCGTFVGDELQISVYQRKRTITSSYSIQACDQQPGLPHSNSALFNSGEIKSWLARCDASHTECALGTASSTSISIPEFRLIDTIKGCVVHAGPNPSYCALSYVWGTVSQVTLTTSNASDMEAEGAFFRDEIILSQSIMDAIRLCQEIDERYLWVDSLCIHQDEEENKLAQINKMDAIYESATLTIVAAAEDHANAGLPPYNFSGQKQPCIENFQGQAFIACPSPALAASGIAESKWASRGWTLQESALSRRLLVFTADYAFLQCKNTLWGQGFGLSFWPSRDLPVYRLSAPLSDSRLYSNVFPELVAEYVKRDLTNSNDMLNALSGMLNRLGDHIGPISWGLPVREFGIALSWAARTTFPVKRRLEFPSWSWAGWFHSTVTTAQSVHHDSLYRGLDSRLLNISVLTCFNLGGKPYNRYFDRSSIDRVYGLLDSFVQKSRDAATSSLPLLEHVKDSFTPPVDSETVVRKLSSSSSDPKPPLSHHVCFWTSWARMRVNRTPSKIYRGSGIALGRFIIENPLYGQPNQPIQVGNIHLDIAWRDSQPDHLEFIVINANIHRFGEMRTVANTKVRAPAVRFGLMVVQRYSNTRPDVYTRVPSRNADVDHGYWIHFKARKRLIILV